MRPSLPSSGLVTFANVSFADCEEQAIWAQQVPLDLNSLTFDEGSESGLELTGVSGSVNGVDATHFNGQGAIVSLNNLAPGFVLSDVEGTSPAKAASSVKATRTSPLSAFS